MMNAIKYFDTTLDKISINSKDLYELMGYGSHIPSEEVLGIIDEITNQLRTICKPRYGYMLCKGKVISKEHIQIENTIFKPGAIITNAMKEAQQIAIFTATVGMQFDDWFHQLKEENNIVCDFVANTLGSVIAEAIVELLTKQLAKDAAECNLLTSNNYSPGYCDWELKEQKKLFSIFPSNITRISLTDSCLMLPIKSVSGIIAVGENVKKRPYKCDICRMNNCVRNKKKQVESLALN